MNAGFTVDELRKGIKNPYFNKLCRKVEVIVTHADYEIFLDTARQNGERIKPEDVMSRCLIDYAKMLQEHE
ncbi:MAG: hypothetical protein FWC73_09890 [Defluviitaleaceae bacterium]|nr:hypothetical protein [Defluviitaleaceae bacterium]